MIHDIFSNAEQLITYYNINVVDLAALKSRVWTQIQHYTWFLSLLLVIGPVSLITQDGTNQNQHFGLVFSLPIAGIILSIIAFSIIRKDLNYMALCDSKLIFIERHLGVLKQKNIIDLRLKRGLNEDYSVIKDFEEQGKIKFFSLKGWKIRKLILVSFLFYIVIGIFEVLYFLFVI